VRCRCPLAEAPAFALGSYLENKEQIAELLGDNQLPDNELGYQERGPEDLHADA